MRKAFETFESKKYKELSKLRKDAPKNGTFTIMEEF